MSSLSYSDEHLAWQQRVQKEVTAAAGFLHHFEPVKKPLKITTFLKPFKANDKQLMSKTLNFNNDLRSTNIHAEVRGKYARMPVLNPRSFSTKHNAFDHHFNLTGNPAEHSRTLLKRRQRFIRLRNSQSPPKTAEVIENDVKELTRLLKIERVKRLIVQKRLECQ